MSGEGPAIIICQDVSLGYNRQAFVRSLSLSVYPGDYLCIVGENGSGKTTFIKGILGLLSPLEGVITLSGNLRKGGIGYLSQETAAKDDFPAGVWEIVLSGMTGRAGLRPFYSREEKNLAEENMGLLEIGDLRNCCFRELSGGQKRRVLIARALCASRKLLVLDEPAAGLDPLVTSEFYSLLKKLNQEMGAAIVMVTHDTEAAVAYAGRILHLKNGAYFFGRTGEYLLSDFGKEFINRRSK
jgi:zinc transport system ATP-binding protein